MLADLTICTRMGVSSPYKQSVHFRMSVLGCDVPVDPQMLKCGSTVDPWSKNTVLSIDMKERKNFKYQVFMEILYFLLVYSDFF